MAVYPSSAPSAIDGVQPTLNLYSALPDRLG
jgi:hypothetical protein